MLRARARGLRLRIGPNAFGNALGNSLADQMRSSGAQSSGASGGSGESGSSGEGGKPALANVIANANATSERGAMNYSEYGYEQSIPLVERLGLVSPPQMSVAPGGNPGSGGYLGFNTNLPETPLAGEPYQANATYYRDKSDSVAANTNASAMGITDAQVDAAIANGETSGWDAASYAGRVLGYKTWNFVTVGFVERHDGRIQANANGRLSDANFWKATAIDAGASVGSLVVAGRAAGYVAGRFGTGYLGSTISGAAGGGAWDLSLQGAQNATYLATNGQTGKFGFSAVELATATALGGAAGFGSKVLSQYGEYGITLGDLGPANGPLGMQRGAIALKLVVPKPATYSVAFETQLASGDFGRSRTVHFNRSNAALDDALKMDAEFAKHMDNLIPDVHATASSVGGRNTPKGWTWEHASSSTASGQLGVMRLVPTVQHTPGSPWWRALHPDRGAAGGYSEWAIPAGAPKN